MQVALHRTDDHLTQRRRGGSSHHGLQQFEGSLHGSSSHQQLGHESLAILESLTHLTHRTNHLSVDEVLWSNALCDSLLSRCSSLVALAVKDGLEEALGRGIRACFTSLTSLTSRARSTSWTRKARDTSYIRILAIQRRQENSWHGLYRFGEQADMRIRRTTTATNDVQEMSF